jgi:ketosteroid isomerase-like protein
MGSISNHLGWLAWSPVKELSMPTNNETNQVRRSLQQFQDGYAARDVKQLDAFMGLFVRNDDIEMIGIGAAMRGGDEWFQGWEQVRHIIKGDWTYWGDVQLDVEEAKITVSGDVAWLSTTGKVIQSQHFDESIRFFLNQMKEMLEDEEKDVDSRLVEVTHYGMRRIRERHKGVGHSWPMVLTAVLMKSDREWRFHTLHWSMPVD